MKKQPLIFHGWLIVLTGIASYSLGYGARYSFSVIFPALLEEFQWPRDITAAMLSIHMLSYGIVAPFAGALVDRIGPRKTMIMGTLLLAIGLALSALGGKPWHFYLSFGIISGSGLCFIGAVPFTTVIKNWFERKRGLAFSCLFFGAGGAFIWYPAIAYLINKVGWRGTFVVEAIVLTGAMLPLIIFFVIYHPREKGLLPDGVLADKEDCQAPAKDQLWIINHDWVSRDWLLFRAAKTGRFWLLCLSTFSLWGIMEHIMVAHHVAFATDAGYSKIFASSVLSLFGIMFAFGSLAGLVSDRIGREWTMTIGTIVGISGIFVLTLIRDDSHPWLLYYYAITLGLGLGITSPTITAATTDIFQGPKVGAIIGFVWLSFSIGGTIGPWLGGWIYEVTNSYLAAFVVAMALFAVSCAAIWLAAPRKVRRVRSWAKNSEKI